MNAITVYVVCTVFSCIINLFLFGVHNPHALQVIIINVAHILYAYNMPYIVVEKGRSLMTLFIISPI